MDAGTSAVGSSEALDASVLGTISRGGTREKGREHEILYLNRPLSSPHKVRILLLVICQDHYSSFFYSKWDVVGEPKRGCPPRLIMRLFLVVTFKPTTHSFDSKEGVSMLLVL